MSSPTFGAAAFEAPKSAAQALNQVHRTLNSRTIPPQLQAVTDLSERTKVFIFNVGPWSHTQFMGSLGRYIIPACPEGKKHSEPLTIPGIVEELYPESERSMKREMSDGYYVAEQIVGIGAFHLPQNSLTRYGVGICRQWPPKKEELDAAWEALKAGELNNLIVEANQAAATGPQAMEQTINERHYQAARLLKKSTADCPWLVRSVQTAERIECKFCGEPMKNNIPRCPNCKEIVNQELYDKLTKK